MTTKTVSLTDLKKSKEQLREFAAPLLKENEREAVLDLFDRVERHLAGSQEPALRFNNKERLMLLLEASSKINENSERFDNIESAFELYSHLLDTALDHLTSIDPNDFLIIRCQACHKPLMVSRLIVFEELGGFWESGKPASHQSEGQLCKSGMDMPSEPDWKWNNGPLPSLTEYDLLSKSITFDANSI
jgi:hypothetical protein